MDHRIKFCKECVNRSFLSSQGIVCGLTNEKPTFQISCPDFVRDEKEVKKLAERVAVQETACGFEDEQGNSIPVWRIIVGFIIFAIAIIRLVAAFAS